MARDLDQLLDRIQAEGCTIRPTRGGHLQIRTPSGEVIHTGGTPSDRRALLNFKARLRRAGVDVR